MKELTLLVGSLEGRILHRRARSQDSFQQITEWEMGINASARAQTHR